jgi:hypothetical protein
MQRAQWQQYVRSFENRENRIVGAFMNERLDSANQWGSGELRGDLFVRHHNAEEKRNTAAYSFLVAEGLHTEAAWNGEPGHSPTAS